MTREEIELQEPNAKRVCSEDSNDKDGLVLSQADNARPSDYRIQITLKNIENIEKLVAKLKKVYHANPTCYEESLTEQVLDLLTMNLAGCDEDDDDELDINEGKSGEINKE